MSSIQSPSSVETKPKPSLRWFWVTFALWMLSMGSLATLACDPPASTEKAAEATRPDGGSPDKVNAHVGIGKLSPEECGRCHQQHYEEWRGSMHAYAAKDPVFLAMNAKGQVDTQGKLGQFCIQCHSPVASKLGLTPVTQGSDGRHSMKIDAANPLVAHGVQCVSCHNISNIKATLNAQFELSNTTYYGPTGSAASNEAHPMQKSDILSSSEMCGTCHNVVNPKGALLENTFSEWYASHLNGNTPATTTRCQDCHMKPYEGPIVVNGPIRKLHRHTFVGVDQALIPNFPHKEQQAELVKQLLQSCAQVQIERKPDVNGQVAIFVSVKNINNGHNLPSGSTADRQVWIHLTITDKSTQELLYESGQMDANGDLMDRIDGHSLTPLGDPYLLMFSQFIFNEKGEHVTFPWEATRTKDALIPPDQSRWREYLIPYNKLAGRTVDVKANLRYRTFPPFLIRKLISEGYLKNDAITPIPIVEMAHATNSFSIR